MRTTRLLSLCLPLAALACQSTTTPSIVEGNADDRDALLEALSALEGRWEGAGATGDKFVSEFRVIAEGSVVHETMFPGDSYEMTNMYALDGNSLVMTHYCAAGNQPHMRAEVVEADSIVFHSDGVSGLESSDDVYMGAMTLVLKDTDHIEQHWTQLKNGAVVEGADMVMALKRVP
jgi:hypothetical protein